MYRSKLLFMLGLWVLVSSCATVKAPRGSVPKRNAITKDAFGAWIIIAEEPNQIGGEFIAVTKDSVYVLVGESIKQLSLHEITAARIILYNTDSEGFAAWSVLGSLLTISNGSFLVFTLPMFIITGTSTTVAEAKRINFYDYPAIGWDELSMYARFPQGIPSGINLSDLKPRVIQKK